jgi:transposase InsO family protein
MATENGWRARKIQSELSKLGIHVGLTTISRYLPTPGPGDDSHQRWMTFLRNHRDVISAMDFFVVPTATFKLLYAWFVLDHGRRRVLHFNVTAHPGSAWVIQQLRDAFPDPMHRHLIFDNDAIFSAEVARSISGLGMRPKRTSLQSPWQNGPAERFVGSVRRELLDHVVVLGEDHLRRLLREYVEYYNRERVHTSLGDAPEGRGAEGAALRSRQSDRLGPSRRPSSPIYVGRGCRMSRQSQRDQAEPGVRMNFGYGQPSTARAPIRLCEARRCKLQDPAKRRDSSRRIARPDGAQTRWRWAESGANRSLLPDSLICGKIQGIRAIRRSDSR